MKNITKIVFLSFIFTSVFSDQKQYQEIHENIIKNYSCSDLESCTRIKKNLNKETFEKDKDVILLKIELAQKNPALIHILQNINQSYANNSKQLSNAIIKKNESVKAGHNKSDKLFLQAFIWGTHIIFTQGSSVLFFGFGAAAISCLMKCFVYEVQSFCSKKILPN